MPARTHTGNSKLNPQQRKFCELYIKGPKPGNGTYCYQQAYPNAKLITANANASKLLAKAKVQEYISQIEQEFKDEIFAMVRKNLHTAMKTSKNIISDDTHKQYGQVLNALITLLKIGTPEEKNTAVPEVTLNVNFRNKKHNLDRKD